MSDAGVEYSFQMLLPMGSGFLGQTLGEAEEEANRLARLGWRLLHTECYPTGQTLIVMERPVDPQKAAKKREEEQKHRATEDAE